MAIFKSISLIIIASLLLTGCNDQQLNQASGRNNTDINLRNNGGDDVNPPSEPRDPLPDGNNNPPRIDQVSNSWVYIGTSKEIDINDGGDDKDSDGDKLSYSCYFDNYIDGNVSSSAKKCSELNVSFDSNSGVFSWAPIVTGAFEFKVIASDGTDLAEEVFAIAVIETHKPPPVINNPPRIDPIKSINVTIGESFTVDVNDSGDDKDVDGDRLWFGCFYDNNVDGKVIVHDVANRKSCASFGASVNSENGVISWAPRDGQEGTYEFIAHVTDGLVRKNGTQKFDQEIFVVKVLPRPENNPPKIDPVANITIKEGETLSLDFNDGGDDKDSDGTDLIYSCKVNGANCPSFSISSGTLNYSPSQVGTYNFVVTASDTVFTDALNFILTVQEKDGDEPPPPVVDRFRLDPILDKYTVVKGRNHVVVVQIGGSYKYDGQWLNYTCKYDRVVDGKVSNGQNCPLLPTGNLMLSSLLSDFGEYEIEVTASLNGNTASKIFVVNSVKEEDAALIFKWKSNAQAGKLTRFFISNDNDSRKMNFYVDWGDGTISQNSNHHTYTETDKEYTVKVWGTLTSMNFCNDRTGMKSDEPPPHYLTKILQIGDLDYSKIPGFTNCSNLYSVNLARANTLNVTNMDEAFSKWGSDPSRMISEQELIGLENIDTSKVTLMVKMFSNSMLLRNTLDLNHFNTSRVTNMQGMFYELSFYAYPQGRNSCLNLLDVSMCDGMGVQEIIFDRWNTSNVKNMADMFARARKIKSLDISHFNTNKLQNLDPVMEEFGKKHGITYTIDPNQCGGTNAGIHPVSGVGNMFRMMSSLEELNVKNLNVSKLYCLDGTFAELSKLKELDLSGLQPLEVRRMKDTFYQTPITPKGLDNWQTNNLQELFGTFFGRGEQYFRFPSWNTAKVVRIENLFSTSTSSYIDMALFDSKSLRTINGLCNGCKHLQNFRFKLTDSNQLLEVGGLFNDAHRLQEVDLSSFNINFQGKKEVCEKMTPSSKYYPWCEKFSKKDLFQEHDPSNEIYSDEYLKLWWYELAINGKFGDYGSNLGNNYSLKKIRLPSGYNFDSTRQWYDNSDEESKERFRATYVKNSILRIPFQLEIANGNKSLGCPGEDFLRINNEIGRYVGQDCLTLEDWEDHVKIYANFANERKRQEMAGYLGGEILPFNEYVSEEYDWSDPELAQAFEQILDD